MHQIVLMSYGLSMASLIRYASPTIIRPRRTIRPTRSCLRTLNTCLRDSALQGFEEEGCTLISEICLFLITDRFVYILDYETICALAKRKKSQIIHQYKHTNVLYAHHTRVTSSHPHHRNYIARR